MAFDLLVQSNGRVMISPLTATHCFISLSFRLPSFFLPVAELVRLFWAGLLFNLSVVTGGDLEAVMSSHPFPQLNMPSFLPGARVSQKGIFYIHKVLNR